MALPQELSSTVRRYGSDQPLPDQIPLCAGPLTLVGDDVGLAGGQVAGDSVGGEEAAGGVAEAVPPLVCSSGSTASSLAGRSMTWPLEESTS